MELEEVAIASGTWRTSSRSQGGENCVEVAVVKGVVVGVRDSKQRPGEAPELRFSPQAWAAFLGGVKDGQFDLP